MTRKRPLLLAALLALGPAAAAIDVPLKLVKHPADLQAWLPTGSHVVQLLPQAPEAVLPTLHHAKPLFGELKLGDGTHLLILDSDAPDRPFYNRLYFDANGNRDLTDDPISTAEPVLAEGRPPMVIFPAMELTIQAGGARQPYALRIRAYTQVSRPVSTTAAGAAPAARNIAPRTESVLIYAMPACHMEGVFTLNERTYRVALADSNANGLFGDAPAVQAPLPAGAVQIARFVQRGDSLYLTAGESFSPLESVALGGQVLLEGALLTFGLEQGALKLAPVEGEKTVLRFPMELEKLQLMREGETGTINVYNPGKEIRLPAGRYRLAGYEARRQDDGGNWWTLRATAPREGGAWVEAADGASPCLPLGEPFTATVAATPLFREGAEGQARLAFALVGAGGERVSALTASGNAASKYPRSEKSSARPKEPAFTASTADGVEAASGSFQYG